MTEQDETLPIHIGFIMDGNGRWASEQKLPRAAGHKKGAETARLVIEHAKKRGIKVVTLYAFSTENWKRPKAEVDTLIDLFLFQLLNVQQHQYHLLKLYPNLLY